MTYKPMIHEITERYERDIHLHEVAVEDLKDARRREIETLYDGKEITIMHNGSAKRVIGTCHYHATGGGEEVLLTTTPPGEPKMIVMVSAQDVISDSWGEND